MHIIYEKLPQEIQSRINNIILNYYEKIFNKYKKKRMIREIFSIYNNDPDPYNLCCSNPYDEAMQVGNMKFTLRYKKIIYHRDFRYCLLLIQQSINIQSTCCSCCFIKLNSSLTSSKLSSSR